MNTWLGAALLLVGAMLCLLASIGVLRLPDFFMRMHAATKAGVAGSGLLLLGVAALDGSLSTWIKVLLAVLFLLLTTPIAGHLIGRAGYLSGQPMWSGTRRDELAGVLARSTMGSNGSSGGAQPAVSRVVMALAEGPYVDNAITQAIDMAREQGVELLGVAIIDIPRLQNVGPIPIGAGWHAQQMRERRIAQARGAAADVLQRFELAAYAAGVTWSSHLAEGRPSDVLRQHCRVTDQPLVAAEGWFDQGVLRFRVNVGRRLAWSGHHPLRVLP